VRRRSDRFPHTAGLPRPDPASLQSRFPWVRAAVQGLLALSVAALLFWALIHDKKRQNSPDKGGEAVSRPEDGAVRTAQAGSTGAGAEPGGAGPEPARAGAEPTGVRELRRHEAAPHPGGTFRMGTPDSEEKEAPEALTPIVTAMPQHRVEITTRITWGRPR